MQISGAVAISLAIPRISLGREGWTPLCQREGFVGAASVARLSQSSSPLFPTAMPLFHG